MEKITDLNGMLTTKYSQLRTRFDPDFRAMWILFNQKNDIPCFNKVMLAEIYALQELIRKSNGYIDYDGRKEKIAYSIVGSITPGIFNLGGQLGLFNQLIRNRDQQNLKHYAEACIDVIAQRINHYEFDVVTISLIQGDALGGGFEAALTSDVLIAERNCLMGFPEILFNLFPGMGAYSLVARKIGTYLAEKIILGGKMYKAEELFEMGLVDVLADEGAGEQVLQDYLRKQERRSNGFQAIQRVRQRFNPVTYQELLDITEIWVESALKLTEKDLKIMDRLVRSQERHFIQSQEVPQQLHAA